VCDRIIQRLHEQCVVMINQDSFYRNLTEVRIRGALGAHWGRIEGAIRAH